MRPTVSGFDEAVAGHTAECDGGHGFADSHFAGRQDFAGTLTGEYVDHGDPPWRWYLMGELTLRPEGYVADTVWCESGHLFID